MSKYVRCNACCGSRQIMGGGMMMQRRTPAERVATIHQKLDSAFKLEATKLAMVDTALTVLYKKQDARMMEIRDAMMNGGERPDPEGQGALQRRRRRRAGRLVSARNQEAGQRCGLHRARASVVGRPSLYDVGADVLSEQATDAGDGPSLQCWLQGIPLQPDG